MLSASPRCPAVLIAPLLCALALACGDSGTDASSSTNADNGACTPGSEFCPCMDMGVCDPGLVCIAEQCQPQAGTGGGDGDGDPSTGDGDPGTGDGDGEPTDCHPLMPGDCPGGQTCTWDGQMFLCSPAMIATGDSCVPDSPVCVSGFCAPMAMLPDCPSTHCCTNFCNLDSPFCDAYPGTSCVDFFPDGATTPEVGACLLP